MFSRYKVAGFLLQHLTPEWLNLCRLHLQVATSESPTFRLNCLKPRHYFTSKRRGKNDHFSHGKKHPEVTVFPSKWRVNGLQIPRSAREALKLLILSLAGTSESNWTFRRRKCVSDPFQLLRKNLVEIQKLTIWQALVQTSWKSGSSGKEVHRLLSFATNKLATGQWHQGPANTRSNLQLYHLRLQGRGRRRTLHFRSRNFQQKGKLKKWWLILTYQQ